MEPINILLMVMIGFVGILTLLLGYIIIKNQLVEIIAMPDLALERIKDKKEFSRFAGKRVLVTGCCALVTAAIIGLLPQFLMMSIVLLILSIVVICAEFVIVSKKHLYKY